MKRYIQLLVTVLAILICVDAGAQKGKNKARKPNASPKVYYFNPEISTLTGTFKKITFWGAPGYGSDTTVDSKELHWVLALDSPINVFPVQNATDDKRYLSAYDINLIHLLYPDPSPEYLNRKVRLTGKLFSAKSGTKGVRVIMQVQTFQTQ